MPWIPNVAGVIGPHGRRYIATDEQALTREYLEIGHRRQYQISDVLLNHRARLGEVVGLRFQRSAR